jgi:hypothetical protein
MIQPKLSEKNTKKSIQKILDAIETSNDIIDLQESLKPKSNSKSTPTGLSNSPLDKPKIKRTVFEKSKVALLVLTIVVILVLFIGKVYLPASASYFKTAKIAPSMSSHLAFLHDFKKDLPSTLQSFMKGFGSNIISKIADTPKQLKGITNSLVKLIKTLTNVGILLSKNAFTLFSQNAFSWFLLPIAQMPGKIYNYVSNWLNPQVNQLQLHSNFGPEIQPTIHDINNVISSRPVG